MRPLRSTPAQPVFYGQVHFGYFRDPFPTLNLGEADLFGHRWAPRAWRDHQIKAWQRVSVIHAAFLCDLAVFDFKSGAFSFCAVYDRLSGQLMSYQRSARQRGAVQLPDQLLRGDGFFRQPAYHVSLQNRLTANAHHVQAQIEDLHLELTLCEEAERIQPLIAVLPVNDHRRPLHGHIAPCAAEGQFSVAGQTWDFRETDAIFESQQGFHPRDTFWNRVVLAGADQNGARVTLHLGQNTIRDDARWNFCAVWIDGQMSLLGAARFALEADGLRITTGDERVALTLMPGVEHRDSARVGYALRARWSQQWGAARGYVTGDDGQRRLLRDAFGASALHTVGTF